MCQFADEEDPVSIDRAIEAYMAAYTLDPSSHDAYGNAGALLKAKGVTPQGALGGR